MEETFDDLFRSVEESPSYWMQVAILEFLQSLEETRAAKGVSSNKELATLVGVSPPTLSRWLNGNENLTISTMCRLATALGAAVHIHVADNKEKGRWSVEPNDLRWTFDSNKTVVPSQAGNRVLLAFRPGATGAGSAAVSKTVSLSESGVSHG